MIDPIRLKANAYLKWLASEAAPWEEILEKAYPEEAEQAAVRKKVESTLVKLGASTNVALLFIGSTTSSLNVVFPNILPSEQRAVVKLLRSGHRIVQIGKGRGTGILLPWAEMYIPSSWKYMPALIEENDSSAVMKALADILTDYEVLRARNDDQEKTIEELRSTVKKLQSEASSRYLTTWS